MSERLATRMRVCLAAVLFMLKETSLIDAHRRLKAKLVDFGGWNMPLHYGSQIAEHQAVRSAVGVFDVSHMTVIDVEGEEARAWLRMLLANDIARLREDGRALYSAMLNDEGGVIDDLIVYRLGVDLYRVIVNCSTREKDLQWMRLHTEGFAVQLRERDDLSMIAVQGPKTLELLRACLTDDVDTIPVFSSGQIERDGVDYFLGRTGYTGEDGFEILLPNEHADAFWQWLIDAGAQACGLGARDTLRLEAGLNLYGHEMDDSVSPLVANMAWTIAWDPDYRRFIGRDIIEREKLLGVKEKLVGLLLREKGVLRQGLEVFSDSAAGSGIVTSGTFSPTLGYSIALARVPVQFSEKCWVDIRGRKLQLDIVKPGFVKHGKSVIN